jgi:hypothetical protein
VAGGVVVGLALGVGVPGVAVAVGDAVGLTGGVGEAPPIWALKLPMRKRHVAALVVGIYSFTTQKVASSVGSTVTEE